MCARPESEPPPRKRRSTSGRPNPDGRHRKPVTDGGDRKPVTDGRPRKPAHTKGTPA